MAANGNNVKIKLPMLEKGSSYRSWRMRLRAQLGEEDAWDGIQAALDDPAEPIAPIWPGNVAAVKARRTRVYNKAFSSATQNISLDSEVDKLLTAHQADNMVLYLRLLDRAPIACPCKGFAVGRKARQAVETISVGNANGLFFSIGVHQVELEILKTVGVG